MSGHKSVGPGPGWVGALTATALLGAWSAGLSAALAFDWSGPWWWGAPAAIALLTFLYTGLFISAHDAMHGTLYWPDRRVNDALGRLALACYALFSLKRLRAAHALHHAHPGSPRDPDFHDGERRGFWGWYVTFMRRYLSAWQVIGMAIAFNIAHHLFQVPIERLLLFWVTPSLLSTLQLFYFGTYKPHREEESPFEDEHRARTSRAPTWRTFLACYHFGLHWEHHATPGVPWWRLPRAARALGERAPPLDVSR